MKKITKVVLSLTVSAVAMFGMATMTYADDVTNAKEVEMVVVDDLAEVKDDNWPNEFDFVKDLKEGSKVTTYYKITLDTPSRVYIKSFIDVTQEAWMGGYNMYISTSGIFTEKLYEANTAGNVRDTTLYLDKGTYYILCFFNITKLY